ncbi:MAG: hypothetical protein KC466_18685 [Myxococcales bacterium]|nr:hypothetical protein [Myxococcales bacterium]
MAERVSGNKTAKIIGGALLLLLGLFLLYASVWGPKAESWWFSAVGAVVNAVTGKSVGDPEQPTPEERAEREKMKSLAESVLGVDEDAGQKTVAGAIKDPTLLKEAQRKRAAQEAERSGQTP